VLPGWFVISGELRMTEEPDEGNLHVRVCGGGAPGNRCSYLEAHTGLTHR